MRIIIDLNHAFDVHFFKHVYFELISQGDNIKVVISKKPMSYELIEELKIPHVKIGGYGKSIISKAINLLWLNIKMLFIVAKFKPDLIIGHVSFRAAHIGWLLKIPNFIFTDTDHASEQIKLFKPFASNVITPNSFLKDLGKKQIRINTIFELAYLHPKYFKPNFEVLKNIGITDISEKYFLLRFVDWDATHDQGELGFSERTKSDIISFLKERGRVFISSESPLPIEWSEHRINLSPMEIHHLMAFSTLYIGEGATMASEAAVLGVPSIYVNTLKLGYISDLTEKWELLKSIQTQHLILPYIRSLLETPNLREIWYRKRSLMLENMSDPNTQIVNLIHSI